MLLSGLGLTKKLASHNKYVYYPTCVGKSGVKGLSSLAAVIAISFDKPSTRIGELWSKSD